MTLGAYSRGSESGAPPLKSFRLVARFVRFAESKGWRGPMLRSTALESRVRITKASEETAGRLAVQSSTGIRVNRVRRDVREDPTAGLLHFACSSLVGGRPLPSECPMLYSATIEYALRALAHIATLEAGERILARDLASATDVPRQFLGKILHRLAKVGLLDSAKGRGGGFRFQRPAEEIIVSDVVDALEGGDITKQCVLGLDECHDEQPCPMHDQWKVFRSALSERVYAMTIADLGRNLKAKRMMHGTKASTPQEVSPNP